MYCVQIDYVQIDCVQMYCVQIDYVQIDCVQIHCTQPLIFDFRRLLHFPVIKTCTENLR
ncbi:Uncharacterised protein [Yersinia wautersii]|uniref:Uncharacterized protein n=1 Tax=Yersinia wautersii TaxID=1341643 RepID=A0ABM9TCL5_9GAMM|nr:Uncharacterised protein [Yersinia wautersii]